MLIMIFFLLMIFSISKVYAITFGYSLMGKIIYIDPGHGGVDSGAVYKNLLEKDINLILSKKLEEELVSRGAVVYLTREEDKDLANKTSGRKRSDLANRAYLINKSKCDMYISIHLNYISSTKWQGLQVFYNNKHEDNEKIAKYLTDNLKINMSNVRDYKYSNDYYMYRLISRPGVLIEMGFLSNPNDRYRLTREKYQDELIHDLADAVEGYFNS